MDSVIEKQEEYLRGIKNKTSAYYSKLATIYSIKLPSGARRKKRDPKLTAKILRNQAMSFAILQIKTLLASYLDSRFYNSDYDKNTIIYFLNWLKSFDYTESKLLELYFYLIHLMIIEEGGNQVVYYSKIKNLILNKDELVNEIEASDLLYIIICAYSYCTIKINEGNKEYVEEAFFWIQYILSHEEIAYCFKKKLSALTYIGFIQIGLNVPNFDFVQGFIDDYCIYLPDDVKEQYWLYATALFYFYQKKYNKAEEELMKAEAIPKSNVLLKETFYILWVKIYYETRNYDLLESYIIRQRVFNSRNENLSMFVTHGVNDFLLVVTKLMKVNYLKDVSAINPKMIEEITTLIASLQPIYEDGWLLEKIQELYDLKKQFG
jgi:hypothetical protein